MIHAYDNQYLDDAMKCLGEAMDYAANSCQMNMDSFLELFIGTGYAEQQYRLYRLQQHQQRQATTPKE